MDIVRNPSNSVSFFSLVGGYAVTESNFKHNTQISVIIGPWDVRTL
jgi:ABC-type enterochelin transport system permease subunit